MVDAPIFGDSTATMRLVTADPKLLYRLLQLRWGNVEVCEMSGLKGFTNVL